MTPDRLAIDFTLFWGRCHRWWREKWSPLILIPLFVFRVHSLSAANFQRIFCCCWGKPFTHLGSFCLRYYESDISYATTHEKLLLTLDCQTQLHLLLLLLCCIQKLCCDFKIRSSCRFRFIKKKPKVLETSTAFPLHNLCRLCDDRKKNGVLCL